VKRTSAKNVLAQFFQLEETASGYIASCPDLRGSLRRKCEARCRGRRVPAAAHATGEQVTRTSDEEIQDWLRSGEAKAKSFLSTLETSVAHADRANTKCCVPPLFDLKEKCSTKASSEVS